MHEHARHIGMSTFKTHDTSSLSRRLETNGVRHIIVRHFANEGRIGDTSGWHTSVLLNCTLQLGPNIFFKHNIISKRFAWFT